MSRLPRVTVVIPVYNQEKYVHEAIESILAQTFADFELIVIDDGSTDRSREIVRTYQDPRLHLVCNEKNLGIPKTHNRGLQLARGEYHAILDHDDYAYPERLAKQVRFLDTHKDYALVGCWVTTMDAAGRLSRKVVQRSVSPEEVRAQLLFRSPLQHSSTMGRTNILRAYGYGEEFAVCDDLDLYTRLSARYKIGSLPEILVRRRHYGGQFTRTAEERMNQETKEIFGRQLTELGIAFTVEDLERHLRLRGALGHTPDLEYLEWADAWLRRLKEANNRTRQYAEPWFTHVLQERWFKICRRASGDLGWVAWRRFWRSPLRSGIWQLALRKIPGTGSQFREYSRAGASNS